MAVNPVFEVKGRTYLYASTTAGATAFNSTGMQQIGQTDAEDVPAPEERIHTRVEHTNESGPELPAKILHLGRSWLIRFPFIKWDEAALQALINTVGAGAEGDLGTLGADVPMFSVGITGTIAGSKAYVFPYCRVLDTRNVERWGLMAARNILTFEAFPNMSALSTAGTKVYTAVTVS